MLEFIGSLLLTPGTPIRLVLAFPLIAGQRYDTLIISQRRVNAGFIFVGDKEMTGEADMMFAIPPASATSCPFANINLAVVNRSDPVIIETVTVDGSAAETIQISGLKA
jgi:hypothetical protein